MAGRPTKQTCMGIRSSTIFFMMPESTRNCVQAPLRVRFTIRDAAFDDLRARHRMPFIKQAIGKGSRTLAIATCAKAKVVPDSRPPEPFIQSVVVAVPCSINALRE